MPTKKAKAKKQVLYHKDGTIWAMGQSIGRVMTGYWECFRKDGSRMRSVYFDNGDQVGEWTTYDKHGDVYKATSMRRKAK